MSTRLIQRQTKTRTAVPTSNFKLGDCIKYADNQMTHYFCLENGYWLHIMDAYYGNMINSIHSDRLSLPDDYQMISKSEFNQAVTGAADTLGIGAHYGKTN